MPYPLDVPKIKHDLRSPPLAEGNLMDAIGFRSTSSLFQALENEIPSNVKPMLPVYSYGDAPSPPLSRELSVLGVANTSLSVVRRLVDDENELPSFLHSCTIAVKRADGKHKAGLKPQDIANSHKFAKFLRRLSQEGAVAILAQDKYYRFGILKPTDDMSTDADFEAQDFACYVYVAKVRDVKSFLTNGIKPAESAPVPTTGSDFWQPPGVEQENPTAPEFWQPPSAGGVAEDKNFWQPPSDGNNDDTTEFGTGGENAWEPPGVDTKNFELNVDDVESSSQFHADSGAAAADRFYSGLTRTLDTRADSRLYHMRAFNGWVKATQIQELDPRTVNQTSKKLGGPLRILDLACGKGGDLGKWVLHPRGIANYVGIDVARGSLVDAALRVRRMRQKLERCTFTCADLGADVPGRFKSKASKHMQKLSSWSLHREADHVTEDPEFKLLRGGGVSLEDKFDIVSIQFAIHYMMQTKKRARRFFQTVSELLEIGGNLIATTIDARVVVYHLMNMGLELQFDKKALTEPVTIATGAGACRICFQPSIVEQIFSASLDTSTDIDEKLFGLEYTFTLVEGSDHASGVGDAVNLPEWLIPIPVLRALGEEAGLELEYAENFHEFFSNRKDPSIHSAAQSSMYNMKVLNRNGSISTDEYEISRLYCAIKFRKVRESTMQFDAEEEPEDDEPEELDPAVKAKFFPMALMKAKKIAGSDAWATFTSDEKNRLTEIELLKLAKT